MTLDDQIYDARVLIVDDKPANVALLEAILKGEGYTNVHSVTDPRLVEDLHEKNQFDIILLDIRMPHMSGFDVMAQLQDKIVDDYLPILVLTAQSDVETKIQALENGARDFVTKPFERIEVTHRIKNMLEVRLMYNRRGFEKELVEAQVAERTQQLAETQLEFIHQLGRAGEYRDNETGMHVVRMSMGCKALALATGHSKEFSELILQASPMHDVGKIGIPDRILLKPGKLEADEWEIM
ncbi:MAG: response regulator, partial [Rhodospirillaceae bacterium]|nr:response regulator [Rhodospirillaceae bacterium]